MIIRPAMILGIIFLMIPTTPWAGEALGAISGTIGEHQVNVPIWAEQSDFYGDGNSGGVSLMARPVARDKGLGTLGIGFEGADFLGGRLSRFEVSIRDNDAKNWSEYFANLDQDVNVVITRAEISDGALSISGTVRGTLIWRQLMPASEQKEDPSRQLPVDLVFDVVLANEY
jgi:hypothetical protein